MRLREMQSSCAHVPPDRVRGIDAARATSSPIKGTSLGNASVSLMRTQRQALRPHQASMIIEGWERTAKGPFLSGAAALEQGPIEEANHAALVLLGSLANCSRVVDVW